MLAILLNPIEPHPQTASVARQAINKKRRAVEKPHALQIPTLVFVVLMELNPHCKSYIKTTVHVIISIPFRHSGAQLSLSDETLRRQAPSKPQQENSSNMRLRR